VEEISDDKEEGGERRSGLQGDSRQRWDKSWRGGREGEGGERRDTKREKMFLEEC
jgi:hypothetical protein